MEQLKCVSGWNYGDPDTDGKDCRKIATLIDHHGMVWVGIRAWDSLKRRWLNGGEPEPASVVAWIDLPVPAPGRWYSGLIVGDRMLQEGGE